MEASGLMDQTRTPTMEQLSHCVGTPLWDELCAYLSQQYEASPMLSYSACSFQPGWNVKYRKAGRSLCTLYPLEGSFLALVVIGEKERARTELSLPSFTALVQKLYREAPTGMGQKWLMIPVDDRHVLEDVKRCVAIRRAVKK